MGPQPLPGNRRATSEASAADHHPASKAPDTLEQSFVQSSAEPSRDPPSANVSKKKKKHRAGRAKRNRRQSFVAPADDRDTLGPGAAAPSLLDVTPETAARSSFYRLHHGNRSNTSIESEALLDHRDSGPLQTRRQSIQQTIQQSAFGPRAGSISSRNQSHRAFQSAPFLGSSQNKSKLSRSHKISDSEREEEDDMNDRTPLIPSSVRRTATDLENYGGLTAHASEERNGGRSRGFSHSNPSGGIMPFTGLQRSTSSLAQDYDVNNPPSVPGSPLLGPDMGYDDVMLTGDMPIGLSPEDKRSTRPTSRDALVDIYEEPSDQPPYAGSALPSPKDVVPEGRLNLAETDVCFPLEGMSDLGPEDFLSRVEAQGFQFRQRRRRSRLWPDLGVLEEWSREEKEQRTMEGIRARKVSEPLMVGGRLRPQKRVWHRDDEDAPYRFTYFNEEFQSTIHSQTISELVQPGQTFKDLFIPDPPLLSDFSSDEEEEVDDFWSRTGSNGHARGHTRQTSKAGESKKTHSREHTETNTPVRSNTPVMKPKERRHGQRPVFWLDILSPTDAEMRIISKAFGIHPLTAEDIMMQEAREKVELFRHYYFVNYRSFEQDTNSEDYMEPVNMYVVVFREGVISFHFSLTPHPANVRRRIRQLSDYLILSSDWISYAIIDDITDVYAPLIQRIEEEVDDIDDTILWLYTTHAKTESNHLAIPFPKERDMEKTGEIDLTSPESGADMLRRVGECRKKVMALYRLLGNKADVIKGFAKRCNEQWEVAPRSEIGLYLGDIQDHIVTMTGNLSHYENLLSRAHSNYLAQVNLKMSDRAERNADVLGKLTVLGTIVLPLNIVTGLFGMNTRVPGESGTDLAWFWGITGGMLAFAIACFFIAKKMYGIV